MKKAAKKNKHHGFPLINPSNHRVVSENCSILDFSFPKDAPYVILNSKKKLTDSEAHKKLSELLAVLALQSKIGFIRREDGGIGGYYRENPKNKTRPKDCQSEKVRKLADELSKATSPFQVQSCFVLSRAYAFKSINGVEAASIEFFKIIELYVKYLAEQGSFSDKLKNQILGINGERQRVFGDKVYEELSRQTTSDVGELIQRYIKVRNTYLGHGGIRPEVAEYFGDPEENMKKLKDEAYVYEGFKITGGSFFEKVVYDIEPLALLIFSKLNQIDPVFRGIPGCWWQPDNKLLEILVAADLEIKEFDYPYGAPVVCSHGAAEQ